MGNQTKHNKEHTRRMVEFNDIANSNQFDVATCHKNVRGDYTIVFEDKDLKSRITFANVNPSHVPDRIRQREANVVHQEHHAIFDEVVNDPNYTMIEQHYNVRGDLTMVFQHINGFKRTFANVNPSHVPERLLPMAERKSHHTLQDILLHKDLYQLVDKHTNVNNEYTLVFLDKRTGKKFTLANVSPDHIPNM